MAWARQTGMRRGAIQRLAIVTALVAALALIPAGRARAVERIQDGGFEGATCSSVDCTSPVWKETVNFGSGIGLLCAGSVPKCASNGYPGADFKWVLWYTTTSLDASVSQAGIAIPAAPATLTFLERPVQPLVEGRGTLTIQVDGSTVYQLDGANQALYYLKKTVSLDRFAGPGSHTLTFRVAVGVQPGFNSSSSWNIDEVSLDAQIAPPGPGAPTCQGRPATIVGTHAAELLTGTAGADVIAAGGGDDVVKAGTGADRVCGGAGNDVLRGEAGSDRLDGENGRDRLNGGAGKRDVCKGGAGKDRVRRTCESRK